MKVVRGLSMLGMLLLAACTKPSTSSEKIIGGEIAPAYPFMVGLVKPEFGGEFASRAACGGTLIRERVVVTAAHCVDSMNEGSYVILGSTKATVPAERGVKVRAIAVHPGWKGATSNQMHNDIALLFLDAYDPTSFEHPVQPIDINRVTVFPSEEMSAKVIGWGNTSSFGELFKEELRQVDVPVISTTQCQSSYAEVNDTQICAGELALGGADSCQGDSGGPLVGDYGNGLELAGVVSYGDGCAQKQKPGVYTRVASFADWIDETIASHTDLTAVPQGKALTTLVKSHCLSPFTVDSANELESAALSLSKTFSVSSNFIPKALAGAMPAGETLSRCEFSIAINGEETPVAVDLIGTTTSARFVATIGDQQSVAGAAIKTGLGLQCSGAAYLSLTYDDSSTYNFVMTSMGDYVTFGDWTGDLEGFNTTVSCAVEDSSASLLEKDQDVLLVIASPHVTGGLKVLQVMRNGGDELEGFDLYATLSSQDGKTGKMVLTNTSSTDIFSWQMSCNKALTLTDKYGVSHQAVAKDGRFVHDFIRPAHGIGTILSGALVELSFTTETEITLLDSLECEVNGSTMIVIADLPN